MIRNPIITMMKKTVLSVIPVITALCLSLCSYSQPYFPVTHPSGSQNVGGNNVTVTGSSSAAIFTFIYCNTGKYWIGSPPYPNPVPSNFRFSFLLPVASVKMRLAAVDTGEIISFKLNGLPYEITSGNNISVNNGPNCGSLPLLVINGGNLVNDGAVDPGNGGCELLITGAISSVEAGADGRNNGTILGLSFENAYPTVCQGDTLKLSCSGIPGATYTWSGPGGFSSTLQNPEIPQADINHAGTYTLTITTAAGSNTYFTLVNIIPKPVTTIVHNGPLCAGAVLYLSDTCTLPGASYTWNGPEDFYSTSAEPFISDVQPVNSGTYALETKLGQCSFRTTAQIHVLPSSYRNDTSTVCAYGPFRFNDTWITETGVYYDTLVAATGCDSIVILDLTMLPLPQISITLVQHKEPMCAGDTLTLQADGATRYKWFKETQLLGTNNPQRIYIQDQSNKIAVVGIAENSCVDSLTEIITVNSCCTFFLPNAFSPNKDGTNDYYGPESFANLRYYQMKIFNRWGQQVFESFDIAGKWDGTYRNKPADPGTYFYYVKATCAEGIELIRKGDILLIR